MSGTPLNKALTEREASKFGWVAENGTVQSYRHVQTGRHIHIDGPSGQFYNQQVQPISAKEALDRAMPAGQEHSHSKDIKIEKSIGYGYGMGL